MINQQDTILTSRVWDTYRVLRVAVILLGPVVTLIFAGRTGVETASVETAVMLLWSPLFFSIPALMLQNERDAALPLERNFLVRGIKLIPYLLSKNSPVRTESIISTVMWLWLLLLTGNSVLDVVTRTSVSLLG